MSYYKKSLFIALVTAKIGKSPGETFKELFEDELFPNFKKSVNSYLKDKQKLDDTEHLFDPIGYGVYGKHDILSLSLIDDIEFGTRNFQPYSPDLFKNKASSDDFDYQIFNTLYNLESSKSDNFNIESLFYNKNFTIEYPFVCFTQLKLNTLLLVGNGQHYIQYIYENINNEYKKIKKEHNITSNDIHFCVLESIGTHELIVLMFSKSICLVRDFLINIRELGIRTNPNIKQFSCNSFQEPRKWDTKSIREASLVKKLNKKIKKDSQIDNHLFNDSTSVLGFSLKSKSKANFKPIDKNLLSLHTKWYIKSGHYKKLYNILKDKYNHFITPDAYLSIGKGDMIIGEPIIVNNFKELNNLNSILFNDSEIKKHVKETITNINIKVTNIDKLPDYRFDLLHNEDIASKYLIDQKKIDELEKSLKILNISKLLSQRIISLCNLYNIVIKDIVLIGNFIELKDYLNNQIVEHIISYASNEVYKTKNNQQKNSFIEQVKEKCEFIEYAVHDRFFQTHRTSELTNLNLDYNGSVQQILTVYDALFRYFVFNINDHYDINKTSNDNIKKIANTCTFITNKLNAKSTSDTLFLNYHHVFYPSLLLSILVHEVSNFHIGTILKHLEITSEQSIGSSATIDNKIASLKKYFNKTNYKSIELQDSEIIPISIKDEILSIIKSKKFDIHLKNFTKEKKSQEILRNDLLETITGALDLNIYFFTDVFTFSLTFHKDLDLYKKWHISYYLLQSNHHYLDTHKIYPSDYIISFFRYFSLLRIFNYSINIKEEAENILKFIPSNYYSKKENLLNYITLAYNLSQEVHNSKLLEPFFNYIIELQSEKYIDLFGKNKGINKSKVKKYLASIKDGNIVDLEYKLNNQVFNYNLSTFIYTVIYWVYDEINHTDFKKGKSLVLKRKRSGTDKGTPIHEEIEDTCRRAIDSLGGFFTTTAEVREEIFRGNSVIYKTLWHFAQLYKKEYF